MAIDKNINLKELGYLELLELRQDAGQEQGEGRKDLVYFIYRLDKEISLREYLSKFTDEELIEMGYEEYLN
ncbi:hypothetical protein [Fusobacterium perfoetens]|uniref:hypothetical protein n=1 Tax=Fusobacterium perfoetens TaxID=852 RepID=UPI001F21DBF7|nr:hypothetical protein [Fusobacterium perfoetens]MCF2612882.1 hypothetical protein [Fusobacterium perfoetens]